MIMSGFVSIASWSASYQQLQVSCKSLSAKLHITLRQLCQLVLVVISLTSLAACSVLDIGHDKFYCQEPHNTCTNASTFLSQDTKTRVVPVTKFNQLTTSLLFSDPNVLLHDNQNSYLKIWFAPTIIQGNAYSSRYLLMPYVH